MAGGRPPGGQLLQRAHGLQPGGLPQVGGGGAKLQGVGEIFSKCNLQLEVEWDKQFLAEEMQKLNGGEGVIRVYTVQ